ncbi:MAG: polysaccharide biosynthesis C-terminal domain-containing protein [Pseudomonas sp.]|uniref:lipopolysaccharide biosynthesis protein n=1 Tax=Pseudomonas sp. TaxID=306 RepID=UPI00398252AE
MSFMARGWSAVAALLLSLLITRLLSQDAAGVYFTGMTVVAALAIVLRCGLDQLIIRSAANPDRVTRVFVGYAIAMLLLYVILVLPLAYGVRAIWGAHIPSPLWMFVHCSPAVSIIWLSAGYAKARGHAPLANFLEAGAVPTLLIVSLLSITGVDLRSSAIAYAAVTVLVAVLAVVIIVLSLRGKPGAELPTAGDFREGSSIMTATLLDFCVIWCSGLALTMVSSMEAVAEYHVAQRLAILISFVLIVVNSISAPVYARAFDRQDLPAVVDVYRYSSMLALGVAVLPLAVYLLFPQFLLSLFGEVYRSAYLLLIILALGQLVNVATGSVGYLLMLSGNARYYRRASVIAALFALFFTWPLLHFFDALGAALATSLGVSIKNILAAFYVRRHVGVSLAFPPRELSSLFSRRRMNEVFANRD